MSAGRQRLLDRLRLRLRRHQRLARAARRHHRRTAARLLWEALASSSPTESTEVGHITAANEWAVDVGMAARLDLHTSGYLALRGMKPPAPYLHNGALL